MTDHPTSANAAHDHPSHRRGEKLGWTLGWLGGFIWVVILAAIFLAQGRSTPGLLGLLVAATGITVIFVAAPWRHPSTQYRLLMAPIYIAFIVAIVWALRFMENPNELGFVNAWSFFAFLPAFLPLWTVGKRRWTDGVR